VVCGLAAVSDSVHQADDRLPAMRLRTLQARSLRLGASDTLILPYAFSLSLQPANRQGQRGMQLLSDALTLDGGLDGGLDWTGRCHACWPPRPRGSYFLAYML